MCSVHLCSSVRNSTHPFDEIRPMRLAGEFLLSRRIFLSLTELTDLTEPICALFRSHRRPPAYRVHRALQLILVGRPLCSLYAEGVLWARNSAQKCSVKSVSSVRERNTLCERRNSPATFVVIISSRGCVPFLTDLHRRTEHTNFHRDIKSTDFTERYSQHASPNTLLLLIINT